MTLNENIAQVKCDKCKFWRYLPAGDTETHAKKAGWTYEKDKKVCGSCNGTKVNEMTGTASVGNPGLPATALGGKPSDAYKRGRKMKLKKISENGSTQKPAELHVSIDNDPMPRKLPKIKVIKLKESAGAICDCNHEFEDHDKHSCKKCPKSPDAVHKFSKQVVLDVKDWTSGRKERQSLQFGSREFNSIARSDS